MLAHLVLYDSVFYVYFVSACEIEGGNFMKKSRYKKIAFTLIELLLVIIVILVLVAFFISNNQNATRQAEVLKTKYLMTKVAEGIRQFEQDWGELPPSTGHLVSTARMKEYALSKKATMTTNTPYLTNVPTIPYSVGTVSQCEFYDPVSNTSHVNNLDTSYYNSHKPKDNTTCSDIRGWGYGGVGGCTGRIVPQYTFTSTNQQDCIIADYYGKPLYYIKNMTTNTFQLISSGPDKSISIKDNQYMNYMLNNGSLTYTKTSPQDDDNIEYGK